MNDVVCIGPATMDLTAFVNEFPLPDEITLAHWYRLFCGGSSANVSVGLSRLGVPTGLISKVGKDSYGKTVLNMLRSERVDVSHVVISQKTSRAIILLNERGEKMIVADTACMLKSEKELPVLYVQNAKALYLGECYVEVAEKALDITQNMHQIVRLKNVHIASGLNLEKIFSNADYVIMNEKAYNRMKDSYENIIVTKGVTGCYYVKEDITVNSFSVNTIDTTGAGDAFCAGFICKLLEKSPITEALQFGNAAGAVATTKYGAMESMPSKKEIALLMG